MLPSTLAKRIPLLLFFAIVIFYLYGLGHFPLLGPDEPRYAQVAREMFLRGDFVTPTLGGHTWFEKPALLYWLMMVSYKLIGVSEWSARLGPASCGLLTIAAVWTVSKSVQKEFGFWSFFIQATCFGLIVFARAASFDIVITMTTTWALTLFLLQELTSDIRRKRLLLAGFYCFVGLALLAKGLVGLVIPFGVVSFYFLAKRMWPHKTVVLSLLWGSPLAVLVASLWYGPVIARHGWTFIDEFFIQHHFTRFVSNKYHHPQPFWFFPVIALMLAVPWSVFLIDALLRLRRWQWRTNDPINSVRVFSFVWLLLPVVFFSLSGSKLPGYILPALPGAALLISDRVSQLGSGTPRWRLTAWFKEAVVGVGLASLLSLVVVLNWVAPSIAQRDSVRDLLRLADAKGLGGVPVVAQRGDDRSAEFYASGRVVYGPTGEPVTIDELSKADLKRLGDKLLVFIQAEYVNQFEPLPNIEVIGSNGRTTLLEWTTE